MNISNFRIKAILAGLTLLVGTTVTPANASNSVSPTKPQESNSKVIGNQKILLAECSGANLCNDTHNIGVCEIGECVGISEAYQSGTNVVFRFYGSNDTEFFNIRYPIENGETQVENRSGSFTFTNVQPNRVYTIKVQGCVSHTFRRSTCSDWSTSYVTTH